jgi:hypothetical protein
MKSHRFARVAVYACAIALASGCQWLGMGGHEESKNDPAPSPAAQTAPTPVVTASDTSIHERAPESDGSAEALARKTASHVQTMETLMSQKATPDATAPPPSPHAPKPTASSPEPSGVHWADPGDMRLSSSAPESSEKTSVVAAVDPEPAPAPKPTTAKANTVESAPAAANQQVAVVTPNGKAAPSAVASPAPAPARVAPQPVQASAVVTPTAAPSISSDALEQKLAQHTKDNPRDVAAHLDQQLLWFVRDEPVPQLAAYAPLPNEDRELVSTILDGLSNFRSGIRSDQNMLLSKKIRPMLEMSDRLRSQAELAIPTITLCKRVDGFGVYEPIDPPRFPAGKEHTVIVYCEVENFSSQLNDKKQWETRLSQEVALYFDTEAGMEVWRDKRKSIVDQSRNRRHDFFVVKMFKLPANLTIGRYLLKVSIVDEQVRRIAEATLPVLIVAE